VSGANQSKAVEATTWREALLQRLLLAVTPIYGVALAMAIAASQGRNRQTLLWLVVGVGMLGLGVAARGWSFERRAALLIAPFVVAASVGYWLAGFWSNASLVAAAAVVLTGLLLGRRTMLTVVGLLLLVPVCSGASFVLGERHLDPTDLALTSLSPWLRTTFVALSLWAILGLAVTFVVERVEAELRGKTRALAQLDQETNLRRQAEQARFETERAALQAQHLELIGRLAAGIAHDFNNLLSVVSGWSSVLADATESPKDRAEATAALESAVAQGLALTRQLLTLARKDTRTVSRFSLLNAVRGACSIVSPILAMKIKLSVTGEDVQIDADPMEVQQVLLNLVLNARDSMPLGGNIEISCGVRTTPAAFPVVGGTLVEGRWAFIEVRDTGSGIDPAIRDRIFDQFFTTKPSGEGTGLGLATVLRIAQESGGGVTVESALGVGATFTVYLARLTP
jgi:signal transduction histidine kinase